jgi:two-component system response regulator DevR
MSPEIPATPGIRVFILDDDELVRRGLTELVTATGDMTVVGTAATAQEALPRITASAPQVALLDARLPDGSGIDVCRQVRSRHPDLPCVILTSFDDDGALLAAMLAGAAGYLVKLAGGTSIVDGIRTVAAGRSLVDPLVTHRLLGRLLGGDAEGRTLDLDVREHEMLELIGRGDTDAQIAEKLDLGEAHVQDQVAGVLGKLAVRRGWMPAAGPGPSRPTHDA